MSQVPEEQYTLLTTRPPTAGEMWRVLAAALAMLVLFVVALGFGDVQLSRIDTLLPIITLVSFLANVITSALLLAMFAVLRRPALLVLACGFLFTGLIEIVYALASPGVFSPSGLLGAGPQATGWIFVAWHLGFPATVVAYALLKDAEPPRQVAYGSVRVAVLASIVGILAVVAGMAWVVIVHHDAMPHVALDAIKSYPTLATRTALALLAVGVAAVAILSMRRRSLLDLRLLLVAWASLLELTLLLVVDERFSAGWYASRILSIAAASFVLVALLSETTTLYVRLALSVMSRRREQEGRLMTMDVVGASVAHEINEPLRAIVDNGNAGLHWLAQDTPDVANAAEALKAMVDDGLRAGRVIARVRSIFRREEPDKGYVDLDGVIEEVLVLVRGELRRHGVAVEIALDPMLPAIKANKAQLQQVLLNLIANAIEAMDSDAVWPRSLRVGAERGGQEVLVTVEDTGPGIDPNDGERIFDPLFTTKSGSTGLGLPICRSIIEGHGGRMWAEPGAQCGTAVRFTLTVGDGRRPGRGVPISQPWIVSPVQARPAEGLAPHASRRTHAVRTGDAGAAVSRVSDRWPALLSTRPPGRGQRQLAHLAALLLLGAFLVTLPFAHIPLGHIPSYVPVAGAAMSVNDMITSWLLFAHFTVARTFSLLVLAAGYLLAGLLLIAWVLTFPGGFSPTGLLGAGPQSAPWIYMFWHFGFPAIVIAYALLTSAEPARHLSYGAERPAMLIGAVGVACVAVGLTWLATAHHGILPPLVRDPAYFRTVWFNSLVPVSALLCVTAIAVLWPRRRSLLDVWLLVVMWAWLLKSALLLLITHRYDVAWYANIAFALASATLVLLVLLSEATKMHARLALSAMAERREQVGRLTTMDAVAASIAHEINQPLAAIVSNGGAGLRWLGRPIPDVGKARETLKAMVDDGRRAIQVIAGIRGLLRRDQPEKGNLDVNDVIEDVLVLLQGDLSSGGIVVRTALDPRLPLPRANELQLQQVLLNLIANAIEAMERTPSRAGTLRVATACRDDEVLVTVEDNGVGIAPYGDHIFDPFFTTKERGTGLGLAISRSIIEAHGGRMWAEPGVSCGTALRFTLPLAKPGLDDV